MSAATATYERLRKAFTDLDLDGWAGAYAEEATLHHPMLGDVSGREAIRAAESPLFEAFSDGGVELIRLVEQGDRLACEWVVTATNTGPLPLPGGGTVPATGRSVRLPVLDMLRLDADGRIAEDHRYYDMVTFSQQLGLA